MHLRPDLLMKRWSTVELPFLPFLAPRVFTPWPTKGRRAHTVASPVEKSESNAAIHDKSPSSFEDASQAQESLAYPLRKLAVRDSTNAQQPAKQTNAGSLAGPKMQDLRKFYGASTSEQRLDDQQTHLLNENFRRKYEETWAGGQESSKLQKSLKDDSSKSAVSSLRQTLDIWNEGFVLLNERKVRSSIDPKLPVQVCRPVQHGLGVEMNILERLIHSDSSKTLREDWETLSEKERCIMWPKLMLKTLSEHPTEALKVLASTATRPSPPGRAVGDTFDYIVSFYLSNRSSRRPQNALRIFKLLKYMLNACPTHHFGIRQFSIYHLVLNLDAKHVAELYQLLKEVDHTLHLNTLSHFPSKLRVSGGIDERMEVLQRLTQEGADFKSPVIMSVCVSILQLKGRTSDVTYPDSELYAFMLESGMVPNIVIYNVLMQNSLEIGDHETGWQLHDMMEEHGIETDAYTYSLLLSDAKLRNDQLAIERVINVVVRKGIRNAHLVTDLLHILFLFRGTRSQALVGDEQNDRQTKPFAQMLSIYRQYFQVDPLLRLIPWLEETFPDQTSTGEGMLMEAPVPALVVMLTAFLREQSEPGPVLHFYQNFRNLVQASDSSATVLLDSTHICNIMIKSLGSFTETLAICPRLIGDMLSQKILPSRAVPTASIAQDHHGYDGRGEDVEPGLYDSPSSETPVQKDVLVASNVDTMTRSSDIATHEETLVNPSSSSPALYPMPDVYTWSVLIKAFMDHRQPRAAEKVLTMMVQRKVWPNQVTWNSLIIGYARMQDMTMTVDAVNRLQGEGLALDTISLKGLAYFQNQRALIEALKVSEHNETGCSRYMQPRGVGMAKTTLKKTLRMIEDNDIDPVSRHADDVKEVGYEDWGTPVVDTTESSGESQMRI